MWLSSSKFRQPDSSAWPYMARKIWLGGKPDTWHGVAAFLRGDHQVNETKVAGRDQGAWSFVPCRPKS